METEKKVLNFIKTNDLLDGNIQTVYVATSGGADSMALLAFMHKNTDKTIVAVHVNHGIRGATADRDQKFVEEYCATHNIKCIVFNAKTDGTQIPEHASEEWARNLRYNYFKQLDMTSAVIATAHTISDQVETTVFRMARGCGLNGMSGIPVRRENIIRPFLCLTREETEALVEMYKTNNITDESNLTDDYARNKIRHHIVPVLKELNLNAENNIMKLCNRIGSAWDFINITAQKQLDDCKLSHGDWYNTEKMQQAHPAILEYMVLLILENYETTDSMVEKICRAIEEAHCEEKEYKVFETPLDKNSSIIITNKTVSIRSIVQDVAIQEGDNVFGTWGHGVYIEQCSYEEFVNDTQDKRRLAYYLDGDKYPLCTLKITSKRDGDKFKPACRYKTKVVNHMTGYLFGEKDELPVVRCNDQIVYLHQVGFTDNMLPDEHSNLIYKFSSY